MVVIDSISMAFLRVFLLALTLFWSCEALSKREFTAAVFEHARYQNDTPENVVLINLAYYKKAAHVAKLKGADLILFPEYGLFPPSGDRNEIKPYLEYIPDPRFQTLNPCLENATSTPILYTLSCLARDNQLYVVANMGDIQPCNDPSKCNEDGLLQLNANVAFDREGTLIARYHKEHLYFELSMDLPIEPQNPVFETEIGTFATFICFDIIFKHMSEVAERPDVDAILFSTMWLNGPPIYQSVQLWESWAIGNNATLLAANIHIPGYGALGSGIFSGKEKALYTNNIEGNSRILVANVSGSYLSLISEEPISIEEDSSEFTASTNNQTICSYSILGEAQDIYTDYRCFDENTSNYTFVKLTEPKGHLNVCNNGMCCSLTYAADSMNESFYFGVYNGTYNAHDRYFWCIENCVLARCEDDGEKPCATFPMQSNTTFNLIEMKANFTTSKVYPSLIYNNMEPAPLNSWSFSNENMDDTSLICKDVETHAITSAALHGRCYDRDPKFVR